MMGNQRTRATLARLAAGLNARSAGKVPPLALLTDDDRTADYAAAAAALPRGSLVIVRSRGRAARSALAKTLALIARRRGLLLLIAGDEALARRIGADGLHLAQARAGEALSLRLRHPDWFLSLAAHDARALAAAARARLDAVLLSPVFPTQSHPGDEPIGPLRLAALLRLTLLPAYALGGIDARSARRLRGLPLSGLAAIGGLLV